MEAQQIGWLLLENFKQPQAMMLLQIFSRAGQCPHITNGLQHFRCVQVRDC
jgi:hypothetical protein